MRLHTETNYDIHVLQQQIIGNLEAIDRVCRAHGLLIGCTERAQMRELP